MVKYPLRYRRAAIALAALTCCVAMGAAELLLRARSNSPWDPQPVDIRIRPGQSLVEVDEVLGYRHRPGRFEVDHSDLRFVMTHGDDTYRVTSPGATDGCSDARPELWILGGSFTHGWAVDDEETFPWLVQDAFPRWCVRNFGVSGYGTLHALLQLRTELAAGRRPDLVVVAYAGFHDSRNVLSRERRKQMGPWNHLGEWKYPKATWTASDRLRVERQSVTYRGIPGLRQLVIVNFLDELWNRVDSWWKNPREVTLAILDQIAGLAAEHGFGWSVAVISEDPHTLSMLDEAQARGWPSVDISHDINDPALNNLPTDAHPNPPGQKLYAEALYAEAQAARLPLQSPASAKRARR